ncbi:hypothetical protein SI65_08335 [Aspergillus cristatus]|uniref:Uncharacterized protein n=1 Tax=Aspergillus cristatus TaxID=573508 RepID=A0A1E3B5U0_ASPCR|nr:hypothetical protein SI65_08335 [Aspergillus cristatus]
MVRYLYTGDYQTLDDPSVHGIAKRQEEYRRAVLTYNVATWYEMSGLEAHARRYMSVFEDAVDIRKILAVGREVFPMIGTYHELFSEYFEYLKEKLEAAVEANEDFNGLINGFGQEFDHFVVRHVMSLYASRIAKLGKDVEDLKALTESLRKDKVIKLNDCQVVFEEYISMPLVHEPARAALITAISEVSSSDTESDSENQFVEI